MSPIPRSPDREPDLVAVAVTVGVGTAHAVREIAAVRIRPDGTVREELSTQLADAPGAQSAILPDLAALLNGAVLLGTDDKRLAPALADLLFLDERAVEERLLRIPALARELTLADGSDVAELTRQLRPESSPQEQGTRKPGGVPARPTPLQSARLTTSLYTALTPRLARGRLPEPLELGEPPAQPATWRPRIARLRRGSHGWLWSLAEQLPFSDRPATDEESAARYRERLGELLAGGPLNGNGAKELAELATAASFTRTTLHRTHATWLRDWRDRETARLLREVLSEGTHREVDAGTLSAELPRKLAEFAELLSVAELSPAGEDTVACGRELEDVMLHLTAPSDELCLTAATRALLHGARLTSNAEHPGTTVALVPTATAGRLGTSPAPASTVVVAEAALSYMERLISRSQRNADLLTLSIPKVTRKASPYLPGPDRPLPRIAGDMWRDTGGDARQSSDAVQEAVQEGDTLQMDAIRIVPADRPDGDVGPALSAHDRPAPETSENGENAQADEDAQADEARTGQRTVSLICAALAAVGLAALGGGRLVAHAQHALLPLLLGLAMLLLTAGAAARRPRN
ncbi:hypothetical protein [Streptomyces fractus]|uniref:hypothetical protein n=1 Tax=Streptomyces fractus TaxID=641806 RepID=UPI003CECE761